MGDKHKFAHHFHKVSSLITGVKDWEIIAENLSKAGWSWGCHRSSFALGGRHGSLKSPVYSCVSITLPAAS
jgi:hypothetical protein